MTTPSLRRGAAALAAVAAVGFGAAMHPPQSASHSVIVGGMQRTYELYVPGSLPAGKPVPLVLVFHGGYGTGKGIERFTGFDALAERERFVVAYPDGFRRNWDDGRDAPVGPLRRQRVDDVAFVSAVIDDVARQHRIDPSRVFATGISNGAMFCHYLAGHLAGRVAAIAPVCGGIADPYAPRLRPSAPVSVLLIQGTDDPLVPYAGGGVAGGRFGRVASTDDTIARWRAADGSTGPGTKEALPDNDPNDGCTAERYRWPAGRAGTAVELIKVLGGGHTWPGRMQYLPRRAIGSVCRDFDATAVIWAFFRQHPRGRRS